MKTKKAILKATKLAENVYPLMVLIRYNTTPRIVNETVASHSHQVALISIKLYEELKDTFDLDLNLILIMSIIHDVGESKIGDIEYTTKQLFPEITKLLEKEESSYIKQMLGDKYHDIYTKYNKRLCPEALIVKLADTISCNVYSKKEVSLGNKMMSRVLSQTNIRINKIKKELEQYARK